MLWIPFALVTGYLYVLRRRVIALPTNANHETIYLKDPILQIPQDPVEKAKDMHVAGSSATEILSFLGNEGVEQKKANELIRSFT